MIVYRPGRRRDAILSPEFGRGGGDAADAPCVGVLALQGDFREHRMILEALGAVTTEIRRPESLEVVDGLVIPGGESTTIAKLMHEYGFIAAIRAFAARGGAIYGSCAGLITLAVGIAEGDQPVLGLIDIVARRNAFGRQLYSCEVELDVPALGPPPLRAVFIRAPWIESAGSGVDVWAEREGHGVAAQQGRIMVTAFHPELTGDTRVHARFLASVAESRRQRRGANRGGVLPVPSEEVVS